MKEHLEVFRKDLTLSEHELSYSADCPFCGGFQTFQVFSNVDRFRCTDENCGAEGDSFNFMLAMNLRLKIEGTKQMIRVMKSPGAIAEAVDKNRMNYRKMRSIARGESA